MGGRKKGSTNACMHACMNVVNPAVACSEYPAHPRGGYRTNRSEFTDERVSVCIYLCLWPCLCMRLSVVYARSRLRVVLMCARMCHVMCLTLCCAVAMAYVVHVAQCWDMRKHVDGSSDFQSALARRPFPASLSHYFKSVFIGFP